MKYTTTTIVISQTEMRQVIHTNICQVAYRHTNWKYEKYRIHTRCAKKMQTDYLFAFAEGCNYPQGRHKEA